MYHGGDAKKKPNPKKKANFLSLITFFFTFDILRKGYKKDITEDDIYEVLPKFKSSHVGDKLEEQWLLEERRSKPSIYRLLWNCYGRYYLLLGLVQLATKIFLIIVIPKILEKLVSYFKEDGKLSKDDAICYGVLLIAVYILQTTYNHNYRFWITELGIKMKTAFCSLIYRKCLKLTSVSLSQNGIGKIVTLLSKDVNTFENAIIFWNDMWISLIVFLVAFFILYFKVGVAALAGITLLILIIPLQVLLGKLTSILRIKAAQATDRRLQLSQEALSAIKIIKMNSWEKFFSDKILTARKEEMRKIRQFYFARSAFTEIGSIVITFTWYIVMTTYTHLGNILTPEVAYFLQACLGALRSPITISIPLGILRSSELAASIRRIDEVLTAEEQADISRSKDEKSGASIELEKVVVELQDTTILQDLNLKIDSGLNLVTGRLGSGKSALLKTILGDYPVCQGELTVEGTVSYASQNPWLFPSSIRQNILFGHRFNEERYQEVLRVCALQIDIDNFKKGDETIVDDNGRNLSKGQQIRIGLARAVYCDSDIYLLDDCLSFLDVHVQKFVFRECIKQFLGGKIVVLVSNNTELFQNSDNIIVMDNGTVKSSLKFSEIPKDVEDNIFKSDGEIDKIVELEHSIEMTELVETKSYQNIYHEEAKQGKVGFGVYSKYFQFGGSILMLIWILLIYGATQAGLGYSEKSSSQWINTQQKISFYMRNSTNSTSYQKLIEKDGELLNLYTFATVSSIFFLCLRIFTYFSFVAKSSVALHKSMLISVVNATMKFFDLRYFGNILNRFAKDLYNIDEMLPFNINECLKFLCSLISVTILIISVGIDFIIPIAILLIIILFMRRFYISSGRSLQRLDAATRSPVIGHLNATLEGLPTIRAYGTQEILKKEFDRHQDLYTSTYYMDQSTSRIFAFALDLLSNFFFAAIVIRFLVAEKETQAGNVGLAITQASSLPGRLQWGIREWANLEKHMTSVERVLEYTDAEKEYRSGETVKSLRSFGKITYEGVNLTYDNTKEYVLKDVNFTINPGERIGIVGRTGAGKSSLISILFRLYQYEGTIYINGVDIKTISLEFLRSRIAIIPQDPFVFNGTIRRNIDPTGLYTDEEIWEGIEKANLKDLISSLDYQIVDSGSEFSSGQKQLICLVRALISKRKIVVLDEATANVDPETDVIINRIIKDNFADCTVLTIAHKLRYVMDSDRVMVINSGEIVEFDKPKVLMEKDDGVFYKMAVQANLNKM